MPSCDNVGRYFPLLVVQRRAQAPLDGVALAHLDAWYAHIALAATQTLGEDATLPRFEQALAQAPPWPAPGQGSTPAPQPTPDARPALVDALPAPDTQPMAAGAHYALPAPASLPAWLQAQAAQGLQQRWQGCSVWWRHDEAARMASARVVTGLPDAALFGQLLQG